MEWNIMEKYHVMFSSGEMDLLEQILGKSVRPSCAGVWIMAYELVYTFEEMDDMEQILRQALSENLDKWLDLVFEQMNAGNEESTPEMKSLWKFTGRIEELHDRIAKPLGRSKRCDESEFFKYSDIE